VQVREKYKESKERKRIIWKFTCWFGSVCKLESCEGQVNPRGLRTPPRVAGTRTAFRACAGGCGLNLLQGGSGLRLAGVGWENLCVGNSVLNQTKSDQKSQNTWMYSIKVFAGIALRTAGL